MKIIFIADIHGNDVALASVIKFFNNAKAHFLVCAGDLIPKRQSWGYNKFNNKMHQSVAGLLNKIAPKVVACRGNNDAESHQLQFNFPMLSEYTTLVTSAHQFFITHGHLTYNDTYLPHFFKKGNFFVQGHTHVAQLECNKEGVYLLNPGSISSPRSILPASFLYFDEDSEVIELRAVDGYNIIEQLSL